MKNNEQHSYAHVKTHEIISPNRVERWLGGRLVNGRAREGDHAQPGRAHTYFSATATLHPMHVRGSKHEDVTSVGSRVSCSPDAGATLAACDWSGRYTSAKR
ncbi:hypothetical protein EVAR_29047_1 [Eumeta japonica]|uniref:Uncharacterized protein n=1 Tax=Eumeta variegata TaxID=151549 RepID=A0A4C1W476_EUMVA|nr:hypothetical protein EVAR_29047_1 [Eumeta japonica]